MAEEAGKENQQPEAPGRVVALESPRLGLIIPALFAAAPTLAVMVAANRIPETGLTRIFAVLYAVTLPVAAAGLVNLYNSTRLAASLCGRGKVDMSPFIVGLLPLGFLIPQYYLITTLARCSDAKDKIRPGIFLLDLAVNALTFGAVILVYGLALERGLAQLAGEEQGAET